MIYKSLSKAQNIIDSIAIRYLNTEITVTFWLTAICVIYISNNTSYFHNSFLRL